MGSRARKRAQPRKEKPGRSPKQPDRPNPARQVRKNLGLTRKDFSRLTGFSERAIAGWENGLAISEPGRRRLREMDRFQRRLAQVVQADFIPQWLDTANPAFDGLKPLEVIERGEMDRLWNMIYYLESGVAS